MGAITTKRSLAAMTIIALTASAVPGAVEAAQAGHAVARDSPAESRVILKAVNNGPEVDVVRIIASPRDVAAGLTVRLLKRVDGQPVVVKTAELNDSGRKIFVRPDTNGAARTTYFALITTDEGRQVRTNSRNVR